MGRVSDGRYGAILLLLVCLVRENIAGVTGVRGHSCRLVSSPDPAHLHMMLLSLSRPIFTPLKIVAHPTKLQYCNFTQFVLATAIAHRSGSLLSCDQNIFSYKWCIIQAHFLERVH